MIIAASCTFSPDFNEFVCFKIESGRICSRDVVRRAPGSVATFAGQLVALEVDLLIAGRLNPELERAFEENGVHFISGKSGGPDALVSAYLNGELDF